VKAVVLTGAGGIDMLKFMEVPDPVIEGPQDVLVRLHAVGINPVDYKLRRAGGYYPDRLPLILGCDGAGVVEDTGEGVTKFKGGDEVFFFNGGMGGDEQGNYAEYTVIHQDYLVAKPNSLSMEEAASVPLVWLTAWEALFDRYSLNLNSWGGGWCRLYRHPNRQTCWCNGHYNDQQSRKGRVLQVHWS
jgi:NADPH2:quinone reductase